ncbi:hypothetical protein BIFANG_02454 [Bifidobacterium angulatum DSM 20098 = JCM 7096]|uniref:Uncharacterized protein n=1 Tax=Bifidobacterium angulatum DSM 20098 = JCM 7096 TaxID=518635 RepID=C4FDR7_9BIFI|nr:hypothetical protein BIFANG_02454 [Bifidobacterium angulatum DSM 20098 = JCM 7096]
MRVLRYATYRAYYTGALNDQDGSGWWALTLGKGRQIKQPKRHRYVHIMCARMGIL